MSSDPFAGLPKSAKQLKAEADAALAKANREALELLNDLNGEPAGSSKYQMSSPHAPGEEPARDPVQSIAQSLPDSAEDHGNWHQLTDGSWGGNPLPVSTTVDLAAKIRDGLNPHRK